MRKLFVLALLSLTLVGGVALAPFTAQPALADPDGNGGGGR